MEPSESTKPNCLNFLYGDTLPESLDHNGAIPAAIQAIQQREVIPETPKLRRTTKFKLAPPNPPIEPPSPKPKAEKRKFSNVASDTHKKTSGEIFLSHLEAFKLSIGPEEDKLARALDRLEQQHKHN